jgi:hypothetical protein
VNGHARGLLLGFAVAGVLLGTTTLQAQADPCDGQCITKSVDDVAAWAYNNGNGFRGGALVDAIAISRVESSFHLNAIHHNTPTSVDYGLWQINTVENPTYATHEHDLLYDGAYNARVAFALSRTDKGTNWCHWAAFTSGLYKTWLENVARPAAFKQDKTVILPANQEAGQVRATSNIAVRKSADSTSTLRTVSDGSFGLIKDGPKVVTLGVCPGTTHPYYYTMWLVQWYDGGEEGWSAEGSLSRSPGPPPAPTCTLSATPSTINPGQGSALSWTSLNAKSGTIDNGIGSATPVAAGTRAVSPSKTTTYKATFSGIGGNGQCSQTITVITIPPPPTATAPTNVTSSSFNANWNASSGATGYRLDVSTTSSFSNPSTIDVGNNLSRAMTGLSPSTTYYYRVRAYNTAGTSGNSNPVSVTTLAAIPAPPIANAATNVTSNSFTANWNSSTGATGYRLDVSTSSSFSNFSTIDAGNNLSHVVTGLSSNTTYYYRVRAYNAAGSSGNSTPISVTTAVGIPSAPIAGPASNVTSSSFTANWNNVSGATGYRMDVSTSTSFSSYAVQNFDAGNRVSVNVTGTRSKTTYYYRVRAYNAAGNSGNSNSVAVITK